MVSRATDKFVKVVLGFPIFLGVIGLGAGGGTVAPGLATATPTWLAVLSLLVGLGLIAGWQTWKRR